MISIIVLSKPKDFTGNPPYSPVGYKWIEGNTSYRVKDMIRSLDGELLEVMQIKRFEDEFDASNFISDLDYRNSFIHEID